MLSHYVERPAIQRRLPLEVNSFRKITAVSQITKRAKLGLADADTLDKAKVEHAEAYKPAYDGHVIPKNHYRFKFGRQIRRDGYLQDCFTLERKHSLAKEAAYATDYTGTFEKTVLSRMVSLHLGSLKSARYSDGLVNGSPCPELAAELRVDSAYVGNVLVLDGTAVHAGDIILVGEKPTEIKCCCTAQVNGDVHVGVLADRLDFQRRLSSVGTVWRRSGLSQLVLFTKGCTFFLPTAWHVDGDIFTVIA